MRRRHRPNVASYAVLWQEEGSDAVFSGRAELVGLGLSLHGGSRDARAHRFIRNRDLSEVARDRETRIGPFEALRVMTRDGYSLLLAAPIGIGALTEILDQIALRIA